jgi:hypothetical protein
MQVATISALFVMWTVNVGFVCLSVLFVIHQTLYICDVAVDR